MSSLPWYSPLEHKQDSRQGSITVLSKVIDRNGIGITRYEAFYVDHFLFCNLKKLFFSQGRLIVF